MRGLPETMRRTVTLVLLLALGCSSTVSIQRPVSQISRQRLAGLLGDRDATLMYTPPGGQPEQDVASDVTVVDDKVQWTRWQSEQARSRGSPPGQRVEAPIDAVKKIVVCEPGCTGRGILQGAALGAGAGLLLSAILISRCAPSFELGNLCGVLLLPDAVLGGVIGALIGARGTPTIVEFQPPQPQH
jgi:hypothetical protein